MGQEDGSFFLILTIYFMNLNVLDDVSRIADNEEREAYTAYLWNKEYDGKVKYFEGFPDTVMEVQELNRDKANYDVNAVKINDYVNKKKGDGLDPWLGVKTVNEKKEMERRANSLELLDGVLSLNLDDESSWDTENVKVAKIKEATDRLPEEIRGDFVADQVVKAYAIEAFNVDRKHCLERGDFVIQQMAKVLGTENNARSVYTAIGQRRAEGKAKEEQMSIAAQIAYDAGFEGKSSREIRTVLRQTVGEYEDFLTHQDTFEQCRKKGERVRRQADLYVDDVRAGINAILDVDDSQLLSLATLDRYEAHPEIAQAVGALISQPEDVRGAIFAILAKEMEGGEDSSFGGKLATKFSRGTAGLIKGMGNAVASLSSLAAEMGGNKERVAEINNYIKFFGELEDFAKMEYKPVKDLPKSRYTGLEFVDGAVNWAAQGVVDSAESLPGNLMMFSPVGVGMYAFSSFGEAYAEGAEKYGYKGGMLEGNTLGTGKLIASSGAAAAGNTAVEFAMTRAGFKAAGLVGKGAGRMTGNVGKIFSTGIERFLGKAAGRIADKPFVRATVNGVGATLIEAGSEFMEERVQRPLTPGAHALMAQLSGVAPQYDWEQFGSDLIGNKAENVRLLGAVMPFALFGGSGASLKGFRNAREMRNNGRILKEKFGFTDKQWLAVKEEKDDIAAGQMIRDGIKNYLDKNYTLPDAMVRADDQKELPLLALAGDMQPEELTRKIDAFCEKNALQANEVVVMYNSQSGELELGAYADNVRIPEKEDESEAVSEGTTVVRTSEEDYIPGLEGDPTELKEKPSDTERRIFNEKRKRLLQAGFHVIQSDVEKKKYFFHSSVTGERVYADTRVDAFDEWIMDCRDAEEESLRMVSGILNEESLNTANVEAVDAAIDEVNGKGALLPHKNVERVKDLMESRMSGEYADEFKKRFEARVRLYADTESEEAGITNEAEVKAYAENFLSYTRDGIVRANMAIAEGASPLDVFEEEAELRIKYWIQNGILEEGEVIQWLRDLEKSTGDKYISEMINSENEEECFMALFEGFSRAARAWQTGKIIEGKTTSPLIKWFRKVAALMAEYWSIWGDITRSQGLRDAMKRGELEEKFIDFLDDSVGVRDKERAVNRLRSDVLGAVAGGHEIQEFMIGKLPDAKVADSVGNAFSRKLKRLQEHKTGKRLFVDMSDVKQKNYRSFVNKSLKEAVKEAKKAGFDVKNVRELLDLLEDSAVYGINRYAGTNIGRGMAEDGSIDFALRSKTGGYIKKEDFIRTPEGDKDWGILPAFKTFGMKSMPIRLTGGFQNPRNAHSGFGLNHNLVSHGHEYTDAKADVAKLINSVLSEKGTLYKVDGGRYEIIMNKRPYSCLLIEECQGYYSIVTAYSNEDINKLKNRPKTAWDGLKIKDSSGHHGQMQSNDETAQGSTNKAVSPVTTDHLRGKVIGDSRAANGKILGKPLPVLDGTVKYDDVDFGKDYAKSDLSPYAYGQLQDEIARKAEAKKRRGFAAGNRSRGTVFDDIDRIIFFEENSDLPGNETQVAMNRKRMSDVVSIVKEKFIKTLARYGLDKHGNRKYGETSLNYDARNDALSERTRIKAILEIVDSFVGSLNPELRGKLKLKEFAFDSTSGYMYVKEDIREKLLNAENGKERDAVLKLLLNRTIEVIERDLCDRNLAWMKRYISWAKSKIGKTSRVKKSTITADANAIIVEVEKAIAMPLKEVNERLEALKTEYDNGMGNEDVSKEKLQDCLDEITLLEKFGAIGEKNGRYGYVKSADDIANALDELMSIYRTGRQQRKDYIEFRREQNKGATDQLLNSLGYENGVNTANIPKMKARDETKADVIRKVINDFLSFEQILEEYYGMNNPVCAWVNNGIRKARIAYNKTKLAADGRMNDTLKKIFGVKYDTEVRGKMAELNKLKKWSDGDETMFANNLAKMFKFTADDQKGFVLSELRMILDGDLELFKQEGDGRFAEWMLLPENLVILREKIAEVEAEIEKERTRKKDRIYNEDPRVNFTVMMPGGIAKVDGQAMPLEMSELQVAYLVQLYRQPRYRINLFASGFDETTMLKLEAQLSDEVTQIIDFMRAEYDAGYERYNKLYREAYGVDMPKNENYCPGYFYNQGGSSIEMSPEGSPVGAGGMSNGALKARQFHLSNVRLFSSMEVFLNHRERMDYWLAFSDHMRDVRSVLLNPQMQIAIEGLHGGSGYNLLKSWVEAIENGGVIQADSKLVMSKFMNNMLSATSKGALSWRVKTMIKQLPAAFASSANMTFSDWINGIRALYHNPNDFRIVWSSDTVQQRLLLGFSPEMRMALAGKRIDGNFFTRLIGEFLNMGLGLIGRVDALFTTMSGVIVYKNAYESAIVDGATENDARATALATMDKVVRNTAQPSEMEQKSWVEVSSSVWAKPFLIFRSDPRKQAAITVHSLRMAMKGKMKWSEAGWKAFNAWMVYGLLNQFTADMIKYIFTGGDDEEVFDWENYLWSGTLGAASGFYIFGDFLTTGLAYMRGEKTWMDKTPVGNLTSGLMDLCKYPKKFFTAVESDDMKGLIKESYKASRGITSLAGFMAPSVVPLAQFAGTTAKEVSDVHSRYAGEETPKMNKEQIAVVKKYGTQAKESREERTLRLDRIIKEAEGLAVPEVKKKLIGLTKDERRIVLDKLKRSQEHPLTGKVRALPVNQRDKVVDELLPLIEDEQERKQFVLEVGRLNGVKKKN